MGWEWHDRRRKNGKFVSEWEFGVKNRMDQLHIRMPYAEALKARKAASAAKEELSAYVRAAILRRMREEGAD